jgi:hypothetical protein
LKDKVIAVVNKESFAQANSQTLRRSLSEAGLAVILQ